MDAVTHHRRTIATVVALAAALVGGCAGLPRIDPSGRQVFIWPDQPQVAGTTPPATFATPPSNTTVAPVFTDQFLPGSTAASPPQPFGQPASTSVAATTNKQQVPPGWLGITPSRVLAPIGSEVVLRAAVCGTDGYLKTNRRVEWMLDQRGSGEIVTVGNRHEFDIMRSPFNMPRKIDNNYVIGTTAPFYQCLDRGTPDPSDDLQVRSGESWISVTSPVEGTSYITAYMPSIEDWNGRTARATVYWVDAEWTLPASTTLAPGERHTLTTTVTRQSDGTPLSGWVVRYTVQGGGAGLGYDGGNTTEVRTDASGRASVEVTPTDSRPGTTRVNVEVARPEQTTIDSSPRVTLGGGDVTLTWASGGVIGTPLPPRGDTPIFTEPNPGTFPPIPGSGGGTTTPPTTDTPPANTGTPDLQLTLDAAGLGPYQRGGRAQFDATLVNRGNAPARITKIVVEFDPGLKHPAAAPGQPFIKIEDPFTLAAGESSALPPLEFEIVGAGRQCITVQVESDAPVSPFERKCIDVIEPAPPAQATLSVTMDGPLQQNQGDTADYRVIVQNTSDVPAENVLVVVTVDQAFQPLQTSSDFPRLTDGRIGWQLPAIEAGGRRVLIVQSRCESANPRACHRATVSATGVAAQNAEQCTEIRPALGGPPGGAPPAGGTPPPTTAADPVAVTIEVFGNQTRVGASTNAFVKIQNTTNQPQTNVLLELLVPPGLQADAANTTPRLAITPRTTAQGTVLTFPAIPQIAPGETLSVTLPISGTQTGVAELRYRRTAEGQQPREGSVTINVRDRL
jgi:uncharacterized repeat protein (TIGR01451 family)